MRTANVGKGFAHTLPSERSDESVRALPRLFRRF
jgi:hypothetical protein